MSKKAIDGVEQRNKQRKDPLDSSRNDAIAIVGILALLAFAITAAVMTAK